MALSIDMANPSISEPTRAKRVRSNGNHESTQAIFSVYSGRLDSPVSNDKIFLSSQLLSMVTNLDPQGLLCSRARDLYEAMTAQLTANLS